MTPRSSFSGLLSTWRLASRMGAVALPALGLSSCQKPEAADVRLEAPLVQIVTVQPNVPPDRAFTGVVTARVQSDIGFRVPGKVIERLVDAGVSVKAGQLLMKIDPTDLVHEMTNQQGAVDAAHAQAVQSVADEARYRNLLATGATSKLDYDHAKAALDSSQSLLAAAQAQLQLATDNAQYADLYADADGVVVETLAEPGQVVVAGQTVIRLAHSGPREAAVNLPESLRPAINSTAVASLYSGEARTFPAYLRQLSDAADPLTRTFEARYVLGGDASQAPLGATVTIHIRDSLAGSAIQVPLSALRDHGDGTGVWIFDDKTSSVHLQPVRVIQLGEEDALIGEGLPSGRQIVALGANLLHENEQVRVAGSPGGGP